MVSAPPCPTFPSCVCGVGTGVTGCDLPCPLAPPSQGSSGAFSPLKKKKLRTENDFVKFDTPFLPKPLFFRKTKSSPATSVTPAMQVSAETTPEGLCVLGWGGAQELSRQLHLCCCPRCPGSCVGSPGLLCRLCQDSRGAHVGSGTGPEGLIRGASS